MIGRILTIGGATVECPLIAPRRNGTRCVATTGNGCVFAKLHKIPSQIDVLTGTCHRREWEKRRNSAFYNLPRVACREDCSDWTNLER